MKWWPSAFYCDRVYLTWRDLLRLAIGLEVRDGACIVKRGDIPKDP